MTLQQQVVTAALRQWIIEQTAAGHRPEAVLTAMQASGWDEAVALAALEETLRSRWPRVQQQVQQHVQALPDPLKGGGAIIREAPGQVRVLAALEHPRVVVLGGLLSADECEEMIALAAPRLARSETVANGTGGSEVNAARTSQGMFFARGENALCERLEQRISALLGWPVENGEGLQVLRYGPGAEYKPHYDYFDPTQPGTASILQRGGQRVGTLVMYLNTPSVGGATVFPDVGLTVEAVQGNAVFFSYDQPQPSTRTLHGGAPVVEGEKWVATKWLRAGRFE